jgi:hypothetical protein
MTGPWLSVAIALCIVFTAGGQETSFRAVDVYVNSGAQPLAAYQLTFLSTGAKMKIVGIEGGEHRAFAEAPYYDPKAMQREQVTIAAFNTAAANQLPTGRTRVATIHVQADVKSQRTYKVEVSAAAAAGGKTISVQATVEERMTR